MPSPKGQGEAQRCEIDGTGGNAGRDDGTKQSSYDNDGDSALPSAGRVVPSDKSDGRRPPSDSDSAAASCDAGLDSSPEDDYDGLKFILWLKDTFEGWM